MRFQYQRPRGFVVPARSRCVFSRPCAVPCGHRCLFRGAPLADDEIAAVRYRNRHAGPRHRDRRCLLRLVSRDRRSAEHDDEADHNKCRPDDSAMGLAIGAVHRMVHDPLPVSCSARDARDDTAISTRFEQTRTKTGAVLLGGASQSLLGRLGMTRRIVNVWLASRSNPNEFETAMFKLPAYNTLNQKTRGDQCQ
jgi:hypothetical protein